MPILPLNEGMSYNLALSIPKAQFDLIDAQADWLYDTGTVELHDLSGTPLTVHVTLSRKAPVTP